MTGLSGEQYLAQLYAGVAADALFPAGPATPFREEPAAGYWSLGPDGIRTIPWIGPAQPVFVQVRAWEAGLGSTFEETVAKGGAVGSSDLLRVVPGGFGSPPALPANLVGLRSFHLSRTPVATASPLGTLASIDLEHGLGLSLALTGSELRLEGTSSATGSFYLIQKSSDLVSWETVAALASADKRFVFSRYKSDAPWEFYRVVVLTTAARH